MTKPQIAHCGMRASAASIALALACAAAPQSATSGARTINPNHTANIAPPASAVDLFAIAGTVVNSVTDEPIRHASVAVLADADSHAIASTLSDNEGRFSLPGLPAAKYQLTASKRGFRTAFFDEHDEYSTAIVTGKDQDTTGLQFRLVPGAVLRGTVIGDGGDAVEGARVLLFHRPPPWASSENMEQVDTETTDDTGAFEFSNLPAGDYFVAVTAEPWYAIHSPRSTNADADANDRAAALDVAYPATFYDSTTDEASATLIPLSAGGVEEVHLSMHAVPALRLTVQMPRRMPSQVGRPELRQTIFGMEVGSESMGDFDPDKKGEVEFGGVAPGHYELIQGEPPRVLDLDATASVQIDPGAGTPAVEVAGTVKAAAGEALPAEMVVSLTPADSRHRQDAQQISASKSAFRFAAVPQGKWQVVVQPTDKRLSVLSVSTGGRTHAGNTLTVGDRPLQLTVTVSLGVTDIAGFARKTGKGAMGAMVILLPKDLDLLQELARRDQSDSDGSFLLRDVAPGNYTAIAIENAWALDWTKPEFLKRFLAKGTPITIPSSAGKRTTLSQAVVVQLP